MSALDVMGRIEGNVSRYREELDEMRAIVISLTALGIAIERRMEQPADPAKGG